MKKYKSVILFLSVILIVFLAFAVYLKTSKQETQKQEWTLETTKLENGWGYVIYMNGTPNIKQNRIPAIPKNMPFLTEESAKKVGEIMLQRIRNKEIPSILQSELIELGVVDSLLIPISKD